VQAYNTLDEKVYTNYLNHYGIDIRNEEVEDLESLIDNLIAHKRSVNIFNWFFVGYKIPQIGKEFDLIRFGKDCVINIELKSGSTRDKIMKQLKRNKYYLSYIGKQQHNLTYISSTKKLYLLNNDSELEEVSFSFLDNLLFKQTILQIENADGLFDPSDYLVSPFNSTDKFLANKYFLTNQQEDIKSKITKTLTDTNKYTFIAVTGSAGTGKTLLIYDIFKSLKEVRKKTLIIHCGNLNNGQHTLKEHGWKIIPIKNATHYDLSKYDAVIIDEAQRIYSSQLEKIVEKIKAIDGFCVFSYDKLQTLASWEVQNDINAKINDIENITKYKLSEKIRTNKEIAIFIKSLFNNKRNFPLINKGNIVLNYFKDLEDAKQYLATLDGSEWEVIHFTPSRYKKEHHEQYSDYTKPSSHNVIGQEFDGVVVTIDSLFSYNDNGALVYKGETYYHPVKMLFQNITRTRKRLNLVIINNEEILSRCIYILDH
jgi:nucleoside-triphosphatase THEP1